MSSKKPYCFVPLHERPSPKDRFLNFAVVYVTGFISGIALMTILGVLSVP